MSDFQNKQRAGQSSVSKFKSFELKNESEIDHGASVRQVENETGSGLDVRSFELVDFRKQRPAGYSETRSKYGPLAVTDPDHHNGNQRDSRFRLNSLQREPLAVDQEERRVIDELVRDRVRETEVQIRAQAQDEGYQAGFQQGREEAMAAVRSEGEMLLQQLATFVGACESAKEGIMKAQEKLVVELVMRLGKTILLRELATDQGHVLRLARELIASTDLRDHLRLKVSARDIEQASQLNAELLKSFPDLKNLRIEESPLVQLGGVILESQWSTTDAAVETQIQRIFDAVLTETPRKESDERGGIPT
jgi:flagellar assembly protein FliH